jgi:arsenate reductase-like glutaredoxin family protein
MTCKRAQEYLEKRTVQVKDRADATKQRRGRDEALALAKCAQIVVVSKGKNVVRFDMRKDPPSDDVLIEHLLGPTGNLRAPALRKGNLLLVGFNESSYQQMLDY